MTKEENQKNTMFFLFVEQYSIHKKTELEIKKGEMTTIHHNKFLGLYLKNRLRQKTNIVLLKKHKWSSLNCPLSFI